MKKVVLAIGMYCAFLQVTKAQETLFKSNKFSISKADTSSDFVKRQLKFEEVNLVSGYYFQDGNNSAITGGRGTEKLTDFANSFEIRVSKMDRYNRTHSITADVNIDRYTSASSDKIDPLTVSSASREEIGRAHV